MQGRESESKVQTEQSKIVDRDFILEKLQKEIKSYAITKNIFEAAKAQTIDGVISIPLEKAKEMLSFDEKDIPKKNNTKGRSIVQPLDNIYFKQTWLVPIKPIHEHAVYLVSRLLGGDILTPTRLLRIEMPDKSHYFAQGSLRWFGVITCITTPRGLKPYVFPLSFIQLS